MSRSFESIENRLVVAPVLASPRDDGGYVIDCSAADSAIGAPQQYQDGQLRVVTYASRTLFHA